MLHGRFAGTARARDARHYLLMVVLLGVLGLFMLCPVVLMVGAAVFDGKAFTLFWLKQTLLDPVFLGKLGNSLMLAMIVTLLANMIAIPLAAISTRYTFKGKALMSGLVLAPLVLPPFVGAIGMQQLLGKFGSFTMLLQALGLFAPGQGVNWLRDGGFWACAGLITLGLYPIVFLNVQAALANIDPAMQEAAENLGGSRFTNFRRVTLPLAMPGIFAGSALCFIWAFTDLGIPLLLDYRPVVSRALFDDLAIVAAGRGAEAFAKVLVVLVISVLVYVIGKSTVGRHSYAMTSKAATTQTAKNLGWGQSLLALLPFAVVIFLAMLPHLGVILYSFTAIAVEPGVGWGEPGTFGWYRSIIPTRYTLNGYYSVFRTPEIYVAIINSLKYAAISTAADVVIGVAVAWLLVRTRVIGRHLVDALAMLPLAVPGLVMAFGYLAMIPMLIWGMKLVGINVDFKWFATHPMLLLVIAYSMRRLPYMVRSAAGGLQQTSVTLEEAGFNLGGSGWQVLRRITIPLMMANLIAGTLLTFSFAMLEVSDSIILTQYDADYPLAKKLYVLGTDTAGPDNIRNACALGVIAMILLGGTILGAALLMGKRLGALFRA